MRNQYAMNFPHTTINLARLCYALLHNISPEQLKSITVSSRKKENIILFVDLVNCFQGLEEDEMEYIL